MEPFEFRKTGSTTVHLDGYPSLFYTSYTVGPMTEIVAPGAFTRSISRPDLDVVLRLEHQGMPLARTTSGTLRLSQDAKGLRAQADLDTRDPEVQGLMVKYERGDLDGQMSFAFRCEQDDFSADHSTRTIRSADLHRGDVSIVTYGASSTTYSTLSRAERRAMADQIRATGWFGPGLLLRDEPALTPPGYDRECGTSELSLKRPRSHRPSTPAELRLRSALLSSRAAESEYWQAVHERERMTGRTTDATRREAIAVTTRLGIEARRRGDRQLTEAAQIAQAVEIQAQVLGL